MWFRWISINTIHFTVNCLLTNWESREKREYIIVLDCGWIMPGEKGKLCSIYVISLSATFLGTRLSHKLRLRNICIGASHGTFCTKADYKHTYKFYIKHVLYCHAYAATIIDGVLDWQLDLLDHTQLHTITVYTLYDSQQLSLFSCSEDFGSNSATTAAIMASLAITH
jgi:hypothetical protein